MAALNSSLWLELIKTNKENVIDIIDCFIADLLDLKVAIMNDDDKKLYRHLEVLVIEERSWSSAKYSTKTVTTQI